MKTPDENGAPRGADASRDALLHHVIYAEAVLEQARRAAGAGRPEGASPLRALRAVVGNGFFLLLAGALISNCLVPRFQREQEQRQARVQARKDALAQFLVYTNTRWRELALLPPLLVQKHMDATAYGAVLRAQQEIKVARYDAYAKLKALAIVARGGDRVSERLERELHDYAVEINQVSMAVESWLYNRYCYSNRCVSAGALPLDPDFEPLGSYLAIGDASERLMKRDDAVAESFAAALHPQQEAP